MAELVFDIDNSSLETVRTLQIGANFDEMEAALKELIEPYKNLIVTEDALPQAKADRAKINKIFKNLDDRRKMVKKLYNEPYKVFEDNCKCLTDICKEASANLDEQIKDYENRTKAKKIEMLREFFESIPKKHPEYAHFEKCENAKWSNMTYPVEDAQKEIEDYVLRVETDVEAILSMGSKYEPALLDEYKKTGDVSATLMFKKRLEESDRVMEQRRKEAEQAETAKAEKATTTAPSIPDGSVKYTPCSYNVICRRAEDEDALYKFCTAHGLTITKGGNVL